MTFKTSFLFTLIALLTPVIASRDQFQHWYPEYRFIFQRIMRENCSDGYAYYLAGQKNWTQFKAQDRWIGSPGTSMLVFPTAYCVLNNSSDWMKANMAGAAVLLGLTPAILAALGPSVEEISSLFIVARRPLLGICIAAGAPSLYPFRTIDYKKVIETLGDRNSHVHPIHFTRPYQYIVMILEVIVAAGAIFNNATNSYQLGMQTICVFAAHLWYLPLLWAFLGILAHLFGSWALWSRLNCERPYKNVFDWFRIQFTPIAQQKPLVVQPCEETVFSVVISWWVSVYIACHLIFGTLTFSSLIFITVRDAVSVIGRFVISLLMCRAILMCELVVLRDKYREKRECLESGQAELQALRVQDNHSLAESWNEYGIEAQEARAF